MEIRQYKISECIDKISDIGNSSFNHFYTKEKILERLKEKQYWIFIIEEENFPIGFEISYKENSDTYLWLMGVHPNHRRKGLGSKLIDIQTEVSREEGYSKIRIKTHDGHPEAIKLYLKNGFVKVGIDLDHWGIGKDAILFEKSINNKL